MRKKFHLPMTLSHRVSQKESGVWIAHSLDFDLVEVGKTEPEAWDNLMLAVKSYVEFGLSKGWEDYILCDAPKEFGVTEGMEIKIMPPLEIADVKQAVMVVRLHESPRAA